MEKILSHVDVNFLVNDSVRGGVTFTIPATLNESLTLLSMPSVSPYISSLIPVYELSPMSEPGDQE